MLLKNTLLIGVGFLVLSSCSHSVPADQASIHGYVITPKGGPTIGPLSGAHVKIEDESGDSVLTATSDPSGNFIATVNPGNYTLDAQPIPGDKLRVPPTKIKLTVKAGQVSFDTLYYDSPLMKAKK